MLFLLLSCLFLRVCEGLELSEGEAFALLEDMFGGLLPPEALEEAFARSGENLEEVRNYPGIIYGKLVY